MVKAQPTLLVYDGHFLPGALKAERVTEEEILAALRAQGLASLAEAAAAVLETGGDLRVLRRSTPGPQSVLRNVPPGRAATAH